MDKKFIKIILKGIAVAMGVAVVEMSVLKAVDLNAAVYMLSMGLTALALVNFLE